MSYIYLYGMVLATEGLLLKGPYPEADSTVSIKCRKFHLGGETGNAAAILTSLGEAVKVGGTHIGSRNKDLIKNYFAGTTADISELKESDFEGVVDYMIIAGDTRTGFGDWDNYYARSEPWYEPASEEAIKNCSVASLDPFFGTEGALYCHKYGKKYVTMDSHYTSDFTKYAEVIAISHEYLDTTFPGKTYEELMALYTAHTNALVIFTCGSKPVMYARKGQDVKTFTPYRIQIESTLGAGDSFKAGATYALAKGANDDEIVKLACATAAASCMHYPICEQPPTKALLSEIMAGVHAI